MCLSGQSAVIALWKAVGVFRKWNDPGRDIEKTLDGEHSTIQTGELNRYVVASIMCGEDGTMENGLVRRAQQPKKTACVRGDLEGSVAYPQR